MNHCFPFIRPANEFKRGGVRWGGGRLRLTGCLVMGGMVIFIMRMTLAPPRCPRVWRMLVCPYQVTWMWKQQMMEDLCGLWFRGLYKLYQTVEIGKPQKTCFRCCKGKYVFAKCFKEKIHRKPSSYLKSLLNIPSFHFPYRNWEPNFWQWMLFGELSFHKCSWFECC